MMKQNVRVLNKGLTLVFSLLASLEVDFERTKYANPTHFVTVPGQLEMAIQLSECMNSLRTIAVFNERVEGRALTGSLLQTR